MRFSNRHLHLVGLRSGIKCYCKLRMVSPAFGIRNDAIEICAWARKSVPAEERQACQQQKWESASPPVIILIIVHQVPEFTLAIKNGLRPVSLHIKCTNCGRCRPRKSAQHSRRPHPGPVRYKVHQVPRRLPEDPGRVHFAPDPAENPRASGSITRV